MPSGVTIADNTIVAVRMLGVIVVAADIANRLINTRWTG